MILLRRIRLSVPMRRRWFTPIRYGFLAAVAVVTLMPLGAAHAQGAICTREYAPVCAVKDGVARTYSNACVAKAEGATPVRSGRCRAQATPPPSDASQVMCPMIYAPVCAVKRGIARTYSNACVAKANRAQPVRAGRCR